VTSIRGDIMMSPPLSGRASCPARTLKDDRCDVGVTTPAGDARDTRQFSIHPDIRHASTMPGLGLRGSALPCTRNAAGTTSRSGNLRSVAFRQADPYRDLAAVPPSRPDELCSTFGTNPAEDFLGAAPSARTWFGFSSRMDFE
jgi:hypothetical protein